MILTKNYECLELDKHGYDKCMAKPILQVMPCTL